MPTTVHTTPVIAFTLCSNNYLAMARVWVESMQRHAPDVKLVIGLVDLIKPDIDYSICAPAEIVPVADIGIPDFDAMVLRYRIVELNTAIKPFLFKHLFARAQSKEGQIVFYFDPDIKLFSSLDPVIRELADASVLLTPHILNPVPEDHAPFGEHLFLNYGIYNLGFCGMRWTAETEKAVQWWSDRLLHQCKDDVRNGLYVDQLWINLMPVFFRGVRISQQVGFNVAYWNLHERRLTCKNGTWLVNDTTPLVFYHFSSFEFNKPDSLGKYSVHYNLRNRPEMRPLFDEYRAQLQANHFPELRQSPCAYVEQREAHLQRVQDEYFKNHPFRHFIAKLKQLIPRKLLSTLKTSEHEDKLGI
jgi:hypothetical protein